MAGVKGRSGRRSTTDEEKRRAVIDKAWETIAEALNDTTLTLKYRAELAARLAVKDMPTQLEGASLGRQIVIVRNGQNERSNKTVAGRIPVQQDQIPGNVECVGNGENVVPDPSGDALQRRDTE